MFDPVAIVTALGLLFGAAGGGHVAGGGVAVGGQWTLGEGVTVGVTPIVVMDVPVLPSVGLEGITLGGAVLVATPHAIAEQWAEREGLPSPGAYAAESVRRASQTARYEVGHVRWWTTYGVAYPFIAAAQPCQYDPGMLRVHSGLGACSSEWTRLAPPDRFRPQHYAVSFRFGGE